MDCVNLLLHVRILYYISTVRTVDIPSRQTSVLYHRYSVCSCRQTFYHWTSRLSCCMYIERFAFRHYLLSLSA